MKIINEAATTNLTIDESFIIACSCCSLELDEAEVAIENESKTAELAVDESFIIA